MSYSFEEIMNYHADNREVYQEIKENLSNFVPFIGAGLTQFAYYSWENALKQLANKISNRKNKKLVIEKIRKQEYFTAAQQLEELRGENNLALDIKNLFSSTHLEKKRSELPKQAISLLPLLFPKFVITTNFDETLEIVYKEYPPLLHVIQPGHPELLKQFLRESGSTGLFKLHGGVTGGFIEYSNIVFTEKQYDLHYAPNSPLTLDLKRCLKSKMMLFLGCSLGQDRTIDFLKSIIEPGEHHYTIINCKKAERDHKIKELSDKNIRAILYEGRNEHEAVRIILERLLEETNPEQYQRLPYHKGALKNIDMGNRFLYNADIIPFTGRQNELNELNNFLKDEKIPFRWWAITGSGGCGKSRLAYEFQKKLPLGWCAKYLKNIDYENLFHLADSCNQKTLFIADYVQEHAKEIGKWLESLAERNHNIPVRVLLVERDNNDNTEMASWVKQLYEDVHNEHKLKNVCFKSEFLKLPILADEDLKKVIGDYAEVISSQYKKSLSEKEIELLLQKLKEIDLDFCRPLYALFLTDAYLEGENPERWNREDILDYFIKRENKRLEFSIRQVIGIKDKKLFSSCQYLYCIATVLQDIPINIVKDLCSDTWDMIDKRTDMLESPEELLKQIGLLVNNEMPALCPDLIGEYFVYNWIVEQSKKAKEKVEQFLSEVWKMPNRTTVFFDRMFFDYKDFINESPEQWELFISDKYLSGNEQSILLHAILLLNITSYCDILLQCEKATALLKHYILSYPNQPNIVLIYANGLVNLSIKQDEQGAIQTVNQLQILAEKYPQQLDIVLTYAQGLVNLSIKQDEQGRMQTVTLLQTLAEKYPQQLDIVLTYAQGLVNLSIKQDEQGRMQTVTLLQTLAEKYPQQLDIALEYANGLVNLSNKQDEQGRMQTVNQLQTLAEKYPQQLDIAVLYAQGLVNLSNKQDEQGAIQTVNQLQTLAEKYPQQLDIVLTYAQGLVNLSNKQDEQGAIQTVNQLQTLAEKYPQQLDIAVLYAKGLVNLSVKQDEQGRMQTVTLLQTLAEKYPQQLDIAVLYAKGLVNLSNKQDEQGRMQTVTLLQTLAEKYPQQLDIALEYANGLVNLSNKQDEQGRMQTVTLLQTLAEKYPQQLDIAVLYAKGLVNLSNKQDEQGAIQTVNQLQALAEKYPQQLDIAVLYAKGLVNLSNKQDEQGAIQTVNQLQALAEKYPQQIDIVLTYAKGLFNLSNKQDEQGRMQTVTLLQTLAEKYPQQLDITVLYAKGLVNLSNKQDEQGAIQTVNQLQALAEKYPQQIDIAVLYAKGLVNLSAEQDEQGAIQTVNQLQTLAEKYPQQLDIALEYAQGLVNLSNKQDEQEAIQTVNQLQTLAEKYPQQLDIVLTYAQGLFNLSVEQDEQGRMQTVTLLQTLAEKYPQQIDIVLTYAKGLFNLSNKQDEQGRMQTVTLLQTLAEKYPQYPEFYSIVKIFRK